MCVCRPGRHSCYFGKHTKALHALFFQMLATDGTPLHPLAHSSAPPHPPLHSHGGAGKGSNSFRKLSGCYDCKNPAVSLVVYKTSATTLSSNANREKGTADGKSTCFALPPIAPKAVCQRCGEAFPKYEASSYQPCRFLKLSVFVGTKPTSLPARRKKRLEFTAGFQDRVADVEKHGTVMKVPMVKICGVTNVNDAVLAAQAGAKFVGMILWPKSRRSISLDTAKDIAIAVRLHGAEPVGVFVDEDAATIERCCSATNIGIAQLHGEGARLSLTQLPSHLVTIYVLHVDKGGVLQTPLPDANLVDWILLDSLQGGSGHSFDWEKLKDLSVKSKCGWLLAGGLKPENVAAAISMLKPDFVDVSSGVTMSDGLQKDPTHISAFMSAVRSCTLT